MKKIVLALTALCISVPAAAQASVRGYTRSDGTYVAPHYRSSPNSSTYDNWSTRGNVNPYTGRAGTQNPYGSSYRAPSATFGVPSTGSSHGSSSRRSCPAYSSYC